MRDGETGSKKMAVSIPHLAVAGTAAGSAAIIYALAQKTDPALLIKLFEGWGPLSIIVLVGMVMVNQSVSKAVQVGSEMSRAQQDLAGAVRDLATRDDREKEEQRRLLSYVGSQQEKILTALDQLRSEVNNSQQKSKGAHA